MVDAANVVGSRPDGWWRDRAAAAARLHERLVAIRVPPYDEVVLVVEGAARRGCPEGVDGRVRTAHAARSGDDAIVEEARRAVAAGREVTVVTADRGLRARLGAVGASHVGPSWLLERLDG